MNRWRIIIIVISIFGVCFAWKYIIPNYIGNRDRISSYNICKRSMLKMKYMIDEYYKNNRSFEDIMTNINGISDCPSKMRKQCIDSLIKEINKSCSNGDYNINIIDDKRYEIKAYPLLQNELDEENRIVNEKHCTICLTESDIADVEVNQQNHFMTINNIKYKELKEFMKYCRKYGSIKCKHK